MRQAIEAIKIRVGDAAVVEGLAGDLWISFSYPASWRFIPQISPILRGEPQINQKKSEQPVAFSRDNVLKTVAV
jgi:hypothetical protein